MEYSAKYWVYLQCFLFWMPGDKMNDILIISIRQLIKRLADFFFGRIAQMAERKTFNLWAGGSNPPAFIFFGMVAYMVKAAG